MYMVTGNAFCEDTLKLAHIHYYPRNTQCRISQLIIKVDHNNRFLGGCL